MYVDMSHKFPLLGYTEGREFGNYFLGNYFSTTIDKAGLLFLSCFRFFAQGFLCRYEYDRSIGIRSLIHRSIDIFLHRLASLFLLPSGTMSILFVVDAHSWYGGERFPFSLFSRYFFRDTSVSIRGIFLNSAYDIDARVHATYLCFVRNTFYCKRFFSLDYFRGIVFVLRAPFLSFAYSVIVPVLAFLRDGLRHIFYSVHVVFAFLFLLRSSSLGGIQVCKPTALATWAHDYFRLSWYPSVIAPPTVASKNSNFHDLNLTYV